VHYCLIVQFEVFDDSMLNVAGHDICELSEAGPYNHIEFVKVKVQHHDLILMEQHLILVIDNTHHDYCILVM